MSPEPFASTPSFLTPLMEVAQAAVKGIRVAGLAPAMEMPRPPPGDRGYAILVDADGADPDVVAIVISHLQAIGPVPARRLHGNLHGQNAGKSWERLSRMHGFERRHRPKSTATKNGADIALAVDALDLLGEGYRYFCLVAGDTDFGALVERLHRAHCETVIVSANPALHAWSPHAFTFAKILASADSGGAKGGALSKPGPDAPSKPSANQVPSEPILADAPASVEALLRAALKHAHAKGQASDGWVDADKLGPMFPIVDKGYTRKKYGLANSATVRSMAAKFPDVFEIETKTIKDVRHTLIRIRT